MAVTFPTLPYDLGVPIVPPPLTKPNPALVVTAQLSISLQNAPSSILKTGATPGVGTFISGAAGLNFGIFTSGNAGPVPVGPAGAATATGVLVTAFGLMLAPNSSSFVGSKIVFLSISPYPFNKSPFLLVVDAE